MRVMVDGMKSYTIFYGPTEPCLRPPQGIHLFDLLMVLMPLSEIRSPSLRVSQFKELYNDEGFQLNLDLVDEVRDSAMMRLAVYQKRIARHYN